MPDIMEEITNSLEAEGVKDVLSSFKNENTLKANVDAIATFNAKILEATVKYLNSLTTYPSAVVKLYKKRHNRLKPDIAKEITNFCFEVSPVTCKKCSEHYLPCNQHLPDKVSVCCILCDKAAHKECYAIEAFDTENGIVFMCFTCLKSTTTDRMETIKLFKQDKITTKEQESTKPLRKNNHIQPVPTNNRITLERYAELTSEDELDNDEDKRRKKRNICPQYMLGTCEYGLVGRDCPFEHPKHCRRWRSYGDTRFGCKRGDDCYFAHPLICEDSEKRQACMDSSCPRIHLAGTKRPPRDPKENPRYPGNLQGKKNPKDNPRGRNSMHADDRRVHSGQQSGNRGNYSNNKSYQHPSQKPNQYQKPNYNQPRNGTYRTNAPRNTTSKKNTGQRNYQSQEVTVDFLGKCLEGIQENLLKNMDERIVAAIQKQFIVKPAQAPMIPISLIPQEPGSREQPQTFIIRPQ